MFRSKRQGHEEARQGRYRVEAITNVKGLLVNPDAYASELQSRLNAGAERGDALVGVYSPGSSGAMLIVWDTLAEDAL